LQLQRFIGFLPCRFEIAAALTHLCKSSMGCSGRCIGCQCCLKFAFCFENQTTVKKLSAFFRKSGSAFRRRERAQTHCLHLFHFKRRLTEAGFVIGALDALQRAVVLPAGLWSVLRGAKRSVDLCWGCRILLLIVQRCRQARNFCILWTELYCQINFTN